MEKYTTETLSSMNHLFLLYASKKTVLDEASKEELSLFFEEIAQCETINHEWYQIIKREMDEGNYMAHHSLDEYCEMLADAIGDIMGDVDETIYNLYTYIAGTLEEEKA